MNSAALPSRKSITVLPMPAPTRPLLAALLLLTACSSSKDEAAPVPTGAPKPALAASTKPTASAATAPSSANKKPAPPVDKLSKEDRARYRAALAEGRTQHKKGDYKAAMAAFEKALAIDPDDPRALAELGWAAFFAKDLETAEAKTQAALQRTRDANGRGSVLYNLGRIAEERGKKDEAVALYQRSLRERPNTTVRDRLAKLDPASAEVFDMLTPRPLEGPFKTLDAYCKAHPTVDGADITCDPLKPIPDSYTGATKAPMGKGPVLEARVIWTGENNGSDWISNVNIHLGIQTKDGWFVSAPVTTIYNPGAFGINESVPAATLDLGDAIPGGAPELTYRFTHQRYDSDMGVNEVETSKDESLVVCSIGASGKPSCAGPMLLAMDARRMVLFPDQDEPGATHEGLYETKWSLDQAFLPDGQIELKVKGSDQLPEAYKRLPGAHPLRFQ